ncbi:hypothetical protein IWZ01DRAFT_481635 [Phyllosticta capitalensis]
MSTPAPTSQEIEKLRHRNAVLSLSDYDLRADLANATNANARLTQELTDEKAAKAAAVKEMEKEKAANAQLKRELEEERAAKARLVAEVSSVDAKARLVEELDRVVAGYKDAAGAADAAAAGGRAE